MRSCIHPDDWNTGTIVRVVFPVASGWEASQGPPRESRLIPTGIVERIPVPAGTRSLARFEALSLAMKSCIERTGNPESPLPRRHPSSNLSMPYGAKTGSGPNGPFLTRKAFPPLGLSGLVAADLESQVAKHGCQSPSVGSALPLRQVRAPNCIGESAQDRPSAFRSRETGPLQRGRIDRNARIRRCWPLCARAARADASPPHSASRGTPELVRLKCGRLRPGRPAHGSRSLLEPRRIASESSSSAAGGSASLWRRRSGTDACNPLAGPREREGGGETACRGAG